MSDLIPDIIKIRCYNFIRIGCVIYEKQKDTYDHSYCFIGVNQIIGIGATEVKIDGGIGSITIFTE